MQYIKILLILFIGYGTLNCQAQTTEKGTVKGQLLDSSGAPVIFVLIEMKDLKIGTITDTSGFYVLPDVPSGTHKISVTAYGYITHNQTIVVKDGSTVELNITLENDHAASDEVVIADKHLTEAQQLKETGFNVNSIETKQFENTSLDVNQILNQTSGVRIRETAGLGSNFNFYLNGLSGKAVKFFIDGQPMENYGSVFNLNNFPVNLIERIDVYKGAVPIYLGADAMGGAVNIITKKKNINYLDASYSYGSFNTHRAAVIGQWRDSTSGFTIKPQLFYNYSDNNYKMYNLKTYDKNATPIVGDFNRFNNRYQSYLTGVELGFTQKKWADRFFIGVNYGKVNRDVFGSSGSKNSDGTFNIAAPGDITQQEETMRYTAEYRKKDFFIKRLTFNLNASYSTLHSTTVDTLGTTYNWLGEVLSTPQITGSIFDYKQRMFQQITSLSYELNSHHQFTANLALSSLSRKGEDTRLSNDQNEFREPNTLNKKIWGLSYQNTSIRGKLQTIASLKYFDMGILSKESRSYQYGQYVIEDLKTDLNQPGYGLALRYKITKKWLVKASYEKAYRLPEAVEIFGDGSTTLSNTKLLPESSNNFNIGTQYSFTLGENGQLNTELNAFYRNVANQIFAQSGGRFISYTNIEGILINGIEGDVRYSYKNKFSFGVNATYQNVLNNAKFETGTSIPNFVYRDRMYNTPYLFGNVNASYFIHNIKNKGTTLSFSYSLNYVNEFYLNYPTIAKGGPKFTIPTQIVQNAWITFSSSKGKYNVSLECNNFMNARAYDNFALQKPGRAFYIKLRYFISK